KCWKPRSNAMITKEISNDGHMVTTVLSGDISRQALMDNFFEMFDFMAQLGPGKLFHLYDTSQASSIDVSEEDVRNMTTQNLIKWASDIDAYTAFVVDDPEYYKLARLYKNLSNALGLKEIEIFDSREDAVGWLNSKKEE
ncbi:MAG: hypothetical protein OQL16_02755, partial [Gammaproteobacteria bacterium]|nr:hypothetical protein [Gammaproteobacteria bacterium]